MTDPNLILLYVESARASTAFWEKLLGRPSIEASDTFAMLPLREGLMLGLWSRAAAMPATTTTGGGGEIAFTVATPDAVDATHADWVARGIAVLQTPTDMDFGRTFTAADPDGHRLRVFCPLA